VDKELAAVEAERARIEQDHHAVARERQAMHEREARLTEREAILKKRLDDKLNEKLREARAEVDAVVTRLKSRADALAETAGRRAQARGPVLSTGEVGELRSDAAAELDAIGRTIDGGPPREPDADKLQAPPTIGQSVFVTTFGATGIVRGVSGDRVDVEVRGMRMRVKVGDLRLHGPKAEGPGAKAGQGPKAQGPRQTGKHGTGNVTIPATAELVLIGVTVDDAIDRTEKFLDGALLGDERQVRIVHGHGTGRLRDALRAFLREHPLVASVSPAPDNQGGNGATIVELKD
jgi:DNA mismatch repair protein MutS2